MYSVNCTMDTMKDRAIGINNARIDIYQGVP